MKKLWKITLVALIAVSVFGVNDAYAISKLDFFKPVQRIMEKVQKQVEKIQEQYNKVMNELHEKVEMAVGGEGRSLFNDIINNRADSIIKKATLGKFDFRDFASGTVLGELKSQIGNLKNDYAYLASMQQDFINSKEQAKLDKAAAIQKDLTQALSERAAINNLMAEDNSPDLLRRLDELDQKISLLKVQVQANLEEDVLQSKEVLGMEQKLSDVQYQISEIGKQYEPENLFKQLNEKTASLFADRSADEENRSMYNSNINRFFVGKYESESPANIAKVAQLRKQEYYKNYKKMWDSIVNSYISVVETSDTSVNCTDSSTMAEGVMGSMTMRICADLQNAKAAAQYMEMVLNEILFETTMQMQSWTDKYKLKYPDKDVTKFNLNNYTLTAQDLVIDGYNSNGK